MTCFVRLSFVHALKDTNYNLKGFILFLLILSLSFLCYVNSASAHTLSVFHPIIFYALLPMNVVILVSLSVSGCLTGGTVKERVSIIYGIKASKQGIFCGNLG